jgi:hypothetical protein
MHRSSLAATIASPISFRIQHHRQTDLAQTHHRLSTPYLRGIFLVEAQSKITPTNGVNSNDEKKYPQNPSFLLAPSTAMMKLRKISKSK